MVRGLDVSHYQPRIAWPIVAASGRAFAFIKATEGATSIDPSFAEHWAGAWAAGLLRGAYHFATASSSAEDQARLFLRVYPGGGELPVALDLERGKGGGVPSAAVALAWARLVRAETGARVLVYCSPDYAAAHLQSEEGRELGEACGLWLARWAAPTPPAPAPWAAWDVWQTGLEHVPGVEGLVDIDIMAPGYLGGSYG